MINIVFTLISALLGVAMFGAVLLASPKAEAAAGDRAAIGPAPTQPDAGSNRSGDAFALIAVDELRTNATRTVQQRVVQPSRPRTTTLQMAAQTFDRGKSFRQL